MVFINRPTGYVVPDELVRLWDTFGLAKIINVLTSV